MWFITGVFGKQPIIRYNLHLCILLTNLWTVWLCWSLNKYFFYGEPLVGPTRWHTATSCIRARQVIYIHTKCLMSFSPGSYHLFWELPPGYQSHHRNQLALMPLRDVVFLQTPHTKYVKDVAVRHPCQTLFLSSFFFQAPQDVSGCEAPTTIATPCHMHPGWYLPPHDWHQLSVVVEWKPGAVNLGWTKDWAWGTWMWKCMLIKYW